MGTSGAYGGSGNAAWNRARRLLDDVSVSAPSETGDGTGDGDNADGDDADGDDALADLAGALADALAGDDATLSSLSAPFALTGLLPRRRTSSGGGGGGAADGGIRGESRRAGRTGDGSRRSVARSAARGGVAIGGAYALRSGNREALAEIGLDLDELRGLGPRAQCSRILDAVLGEAGHPDEMALRLAAAEQLKAIITLPSPPTEADALRGFIAAFVFQMGLVELRADLAKGLIDSATATRKEGRLRRYLRRRAAALLVPTTGRMSIAEFSAHARRLVSDAIALLRAR
jgi:hypothetical protein